MPKTFDLIVFDWDGTLMDSAGAIVSAIQLAAQDLGFEPPSDARARHVIGLGLIDALSLALPDLEPQRYGEMSERYRHHYLSRDLDLSLFVGVAEMLEELSRAGHLLAVATGKSRVGLDRALRVSGLGDFFHGTRCADECFSKPHPQMLEELMAEFGILPGATLMIGDTTHDLQMARNAGVPALAVSYGAHARQALETEAPLHCADTVPELAAWLRAHG
ncbi:HAD-IA family hydrolase [Denitratisoma oestradiolicum]|uniref:HAD family hydrolase n=1 Tax=Denitratisoma oestradiolicum TaxID=311182 RepID=A0A6S6XYE7_9PROT|nr:HAD-IA family hydrolase [Denitratisoma oestradiolicum]TWO80290.1 HAD family hydrolase [Denitratisoma oestradiolicum]CAB1369387.1 HAD family hydrolase [Denitratisoma oestradiolicum]